MPTDDSEAAVTRKRKEDHVFMCAAGPSSKHCKRVLKVQFGNIDVYEIESCNQGRIPDTSHDLAYGHTHDYLSLDARAEALKAVETAASLHRIVCLEYGIKHDRLSCSSVDVAVQPLSVAAAINEPGIRRWLVDTGCPFDLIALDELDSNEMDFVKRASKLIRMSTPNGLVDADKIISFKVAQLGEPISAYVMKSSPTVMSIGRRCMVHGYDFVWIAFKRPFIVTPSGKRIVLEVIDHVPYLPISKSSPCAPSVPIAAESAIPSIDDAELGVPENEDDEDVYELREVRKRDLHTEAKSMRHLLTHLPKNPHCSVCQRAKLENMKSRKKGGTAAFGFKNFGDHVSADTIVLHGMKDRGVGNKNNAVIFFDFGTLWTSCHPVNSRSEEDTSLAFREFLGTTQTVKSFYSDGAPEIVSVANKMGWTGDTSTPGIPRNNSIIENKVKLVVNGGRSLLLQAGLPSKF